MIADKIRIPLNDYSMPNPKLTVQSYNDIYRKVWYSNNKYQPEDLISITKRDLSRLLAATEAYLHFTTHPSNTNSLVRQLREVRETFKSLFRGGDKYEHAQGN